jgi:hypothetical protein
MCLGELLYLSKLCMCLCTVPKLQDDVVVVVLWMKHSKVKINGNDTNRSKLLS